MSVKTRDCDVDGLLEDQPDVIAVVFKDQSDRSEAGRWVSVIAVLPSRRVDSTSVSSCGRYLGVTTGVRPSE
ncbi:hypothetical protein [Arthrobacter sp. H20]|uniref:hypothetical protein n=1 Tax=Arthrobacter sp. H20 TaxID=1267981 RepID=UPI0004793F7F|nr:hypothetical protein [Arthrobacter sp. H20]